MIANKKIDILYLMWCTCSNLYSYRSSCNYTFYIQSSMLNLDKILRHPIRPLQRGILNTPPPPYHCVVSDYCNDTCASLCSYIYRYRSPLISSQVDTWMVLPAVTVYTSTATTTLSLYAEACQTLGR